MKAFFFLKYFSHEGHQEHKEFKDLTAGVTGSTVL